jgi:hypothetical protein
MSLLRFTLGELEKRILCLLSNPSTSTNEMKGQLPIAVRVEVYARQQLVAQLWPGRAVLLSNVLQCPLFKGPISLL